MLDRIQELLTARELTSSQFADTIGVSRPVVSHILSGRNKPSLEVVQKIVAAFPDLSLAWLLNGEGLMVASAPEPPKRPVPPTAPAVAPRQTSKASTTAPAAPERPVAASEPSRLHQEPQEPETRLPAPDAPLVPPAAVAPPVVPSLATPGPSQPQKQPASPIAPAADVDFAQALAEPGKRIRRIVIFYQDGTFADYQPEGTGR